MPTTAGSTAALYPRLLGDSWKNLDAAVQRLHVDEQPVRASGIFCIRRGSGRAIRVLYWLFRLPAPAESVQTQLSIVPDGSREKWLRTFDKQALVTVQCESGEGLLAERISFIELLFRLEASARGIDYIPISASLCLGVLRIPLPRWFAPKVVAREEPAEEPGLMRVRVEVTVPFFGLLLSYQGKIGPAEAQA